MPERTTTWLLPCTVFWRVGYFFVELSKRKSYSTCYSVVARIELLPQMVGSVPAPDCRTRNNLFLRKAQEQAQNGCFSVNSLLLSAVSRRGNADTAANGCQCFPPVALRGCMIPIIFREEARMAWKKSARRLADRLKVWRCRQQLTGCPKMPLVRAGAKSKESQRGGLSLVLQT